VRAKLARFPVADAAHVHAATYVVHVFIDANVELAAP